MWPSWREARVTCLACGEAIPRSEAREYDKYGDRWDRDDKEFEYLCKPCDSELSRVSRHGLESLLVDVEAEIQGRDDDADRAAFCSNYLERLEEWYGTAESESEGTQRWE
ncbi:hypothetical protein OB955_22920 [Halobacteria archaeon AArc-m2/3/4]|uniref:Small CPxCG-related zinc finger protein n=1 Tax=Natronoglomus mannanivorans TaxID=2979990 RepID=A0AAP2Z2H3_9EURY|nr:hypothetical protein [Halobacteria archaeon AArc-xg1-1]MCU4975544.1 hypothetical protein [Halobacteria archaeon AArc-m2/3/4]